MTGERGRSRLATGLAAALATVLLVGALVPAPVAAGDNAAIFYFESREYDVESGETVALDLVVSSHGGYGGAGVGELSATIAYDPDVFTVTDVEHGPVLAAGDGDAAVDGAVEIDDANGTVTIRQERTGAEDGAKATETAATLTLEVADDADPTTETLEIADAEAILVDDSRQGTVERNGTVRVDGGGDSSDGDEGGGPDGVTLAEEADADGDVEAEGGNDARDAEAEGGNETDGTAAGEGSTDGSTDDPVPGFAGPSALVAIAALVLLLGRR